jgi:hypothetical protein
MKAEQRFYRQVQRWSNQLFPTDRLQSLQSLSHTFMAILLSTVSFCLIFR